MGPTKELCGSPLMAYSNNYVDYPDCNDQQEKGNYIRQAWPVYITQSIELNKQQHLCHFLQRSSVFNQFLILTDNICPTQFQTWTLLTEHSRATFSTKCVLSAKFTHICSKLCIQNLSKSIFLMFHLNTLNQNSAVRQGFMPVFMVLFLKIKYKPLDLSHLIGSHMSVKKYEKLCGTFQCHVLWREEDGKYIIYETQTYLTTCIFLLYFLCNTVKKYVWLS